MISHHTDPKGRPGSTSRHYAGDGHHSRTWYFLANGMTTMSKLRNSTLKISTNRTMPTILLLVCGKISSISACTWQNKNKCFNASIIKMIAKSWSLVDADGLEQLNSFISGTTIMTIPTHTTSSSTIIAANITTTDIDAFSFLKYGK